MFGSMVGKGTSLVLVFLKLIDVVFMVFFAVLDASLENSVQRQIRMPVFAKQPEPSSDRIAMWRPVSRIVSKYIVFFLINEPHQPNYKRDETASNQQKIDYDVGRIVDPDSVVLRGHKSGWRRSAV